MKPAPPTENTTGTTSALILGADAVLAAHPASPVQLVHGCLRAGFSTVAPPSWGDELLAAETLRQLPLRGERPLVYCACPLVTNRLLDVGNDLAPFLVSLVSPPVAAARYLRALAGDAPLRITFVGACPSGSDESIDARHTPGELLDMLSEWGIELSLQPEVFESVLPPDRRRRRSLPGGVPSPEMLWSEGDRRSLVELLDEDPLTELAQHLASGERALLDPAAVLGCSCAGARQGTPARFARSAVAALEPPRTSSEVVEPTVVVQLTRALPAADRPLTPVVSSEPETAAGAELDDSERIAAEPEPVVAASVAESRSDEHDGNERSRIGFNRETAVPPFGGWGGEGRKLPRAYMARRRSALRSRGSTAPAEEAPQPASIETDYPAAASGRSAGNAPSTKANRAAASAPESLQAPQEQASPATEPRSDVSSGRPQPGSPTNGTTRHRLFAAVPVATTSAIPRQPSAVEPAPPAAIPSSSISHAPAPGAAAPSVTSPVSAAPRRSRQPLHYVLVLVLVAALSIAVGLAAGRALGRSPAAAARDVAPSAVPQAPAEEAPQPSAPESRVAADPVPSAAAPVQRPFVAGTTAERAAAPPRAPQRAAETPPAAETAPTPVRETASGNVEPAIILRDSVVVPADTVAGRSPTAGPAAMSTDSVLERERLLLLEEIAARRQRIDSLHRVDSVRIDSLRRVIDSTRRSPPSTR